MPNLPDNFELIFRLPDVLRVTGLSRSSIYRYVAAGTFPHPVKLGESATGWLAHEVRSWVEQRVAASRGEVA